MNGEAHQTHNLHKKYMTWVTSTQDRWVSLQTQQPAIKNPLYQVTTQHPVTRCAPVSRGLRSETSVHMKGQIYKRFWRCSPQVMIYMTQS